MEAWVWIAVAAAAAQTVRFALQKVLAGARLSAAGATWARFFWSAPLIWAVMAAYIGSGQADAFLIGEGFWGYAAVGGLAQILATICTVALFKTRAFAVGITFKKTEVMLTALLGLIVLGDTLEPIGAAFIALGFVGVVLLSQPPEGGSFVNRSAALGLASGVFFAISAVGYRGATLAVTSDDTFLVAGVTLAIVVLFQTVTLGVWLGLREPGQIRATVASWRTSALVGVFSLIGSWCWFAAFSLQNAAYVFAVGQIELIFSLAVGVLFFGERPIGREVLGMVVLTASIIAIAVVGSI